MKTFKFFPQVLVISIILIFGCSKDDSNDLTDSYISYKIDNKETKLPAKAYLTYYPSSFNYRLYIEGDIGQIKIDELYSKQAGKPDFVGKFYLHSAISYGDSLPGLTYMDDNNSSYGTLEETNPVSNITISEFTITDSTKVGTRVIPNKGILSGTFEVKVTFTNSPGAKVPDVKEKTITGTLTKVKWEIHFSTADRR